MRSKAFLALSSAALAGAGWAVWSRSGEGRDHPPAAAPASARPTDRAPVASLREPEREALARTELADVGATAAAAPGASAPGPSAEERLARAIGDVAEQLEAAASSPANIDAAIGAFLAAGPPPSLELLSSTCVDTRRSTAERVAAAAVIERLVPRDDAAPRLVAAEAAACALREVVEDDTASPALASRSAQLLAALGGNDDRSLLMNRLAGGEAEVHRLAGGTAESSRRVAALGLHSARSRDAIDGLASIVRSPRDALALDLAAAALAGIAERTSPDAIPPEAWEAAATALAERAADSRTDAAARARAAGALGAIGGVGASAALADLIASADEPLARAALQGAARRLARADDPRLCDLVLATAGDPRRPDDLRLAAIASVLPRLAPEDPRRAELERALADLSERAAEPNHRRRAALALARLPPAPPALEGPGGAP